MEGSRPKLDHFVGRVVEGTRDTKDGHKIYLEGGAVIISSRKLPENLKGKKLQMVIMSETETRAIFYTADNDNENDGESVTVSLHPTNYKIETEDFKPFNPQFPEELEHIKGTPPDPSADRITDGPQNDPMRSVLEPEDEGGSSSSDAGESE